MSEPTLSRPGEALIMAVAWRDFLVWAISKPEMRAAFTAETGLAFAHAKIPLDALIDDATGRTESAVFAFAKWATERHFGMAYAPAEFQAAVERTRSGVRVTDWHRYRGRAFVRCSHCEATTGNPAGMWWKRLVTKVGRTEVKCPACWAKGAA